MAEKAEALEARPRRRAGVQAVLRQAEEQPPPLVAPRGEVAHQLPRPPPQAVVQVTIQLEPQPPAAMLRQLAQALPRPLAEDVMVPRQPVGAVAVHPPLVPPDRAAEELVVAATRTEMLMTEGSISK